MNLSPFSRLHLGANSRHQGPTTNPSSSKYHGSTIRETDYALTNSKQYASTVRGSEHASTNPRHHVSATRDSEHVHTNRHRAKTGTAHESPKRTSTSGKNSQGPLPPVTTRKSSQIDVSDFLVHTSQEARAVPALNQSLTRSAFKEGRRTITELVKDSKDIKPIGSMKKSKGTAHHEQRSSSPHRGSSLECSSGSAGIHRTKIPEEVSQSYFMDLPTSGTRFRRIHGFENRIPTPEGRRSSLLVSATLCVALSFQDSSGTIHV